MSTAAYVLEQEIKSLLTPSSHDEWELAAIALYILNGDAPTVDEIEAKLLEVSE